MKNTKVKHKVENGITLIALIITIIVLLILAGVTINLTLGDNGIFKVAEQAARNYKDAEEKELGLLDDFNEELENVTDFQKLKQFDIATGVNKPITNNTGLIPVTINTNGSLIDVTDTATNWYSYIDTSVSGQENKSNWANARTADNSLWVWIPRYAYKITYTDATDKSAGGTIDVVFLKGITNLDSNGNDVTSTNYVDANGNTGAYIVHPAFKDGRSNGFANGEWDEEITGFWVAKFEAGYAGIANQPETAEDSNATLSVVMQWNGTTNEDLFTNYYGARAIGDAIKYPVFQGSRPSMNNLGISDTYDLCKSLTATDNPYELRNVDSHMTKNSEWGAIAYLTYSKYGRNGKEVTINNVSAEGKNSVYAVTGYAGDTVDATSDTTKSLETLMLEQQAGSWTTDQGKNASTTGNIYGIYDLKGGLWEWTAGYVATTGRYEIYAGSLKGESTKYKTKYAGISAERTENYLDVENIKRVGEAIWEISTKGTGTTLWNKKQSEFWSVNNPFSVRGSRWSSGTFSEMSTFNYAGGYCSFNYGFRPILIAK